MSATKRELQDWLSTFEEGTEFAIDEGGLTLIAVPNEAHPDVEGWLEIGGAE